MHLPLCSSWHLQLPGVFSISFLLSELCFKLQKPYNLQLCTQLRVFILHLLRFSLSNFFSCDPKKEDWPWYCWIQSVIILCVVSLTMSLMVYIYIYIYMDHYSSIYYLHGIHRCLGYILFLISFLLSEFCLKLKEMGMFWSPYYSYVSL